MSKSFYKLSLFGFFIMLSQFSFAVNLGEIDVISKPNHVFLANIELLAYTADELDGLKVKIASNDEYKKFGIEKDLILEELKFSVEGNEEDGLYVQAHAGYLAKDFPNSFLIEVLWPGGQIIKQYDISPKIDMNIENFEEVEVLHKQFQAVIDAVIEADIVSSLDANHDIDQQIQRLTKKQAEPAPLLEKIINTPSGGIEYSPVEDGESLSKIAQILTANKEASTNQVMVALFDENRDAFMDNNIHRLKIGVTLTLENEDTITRISKEEALRLAQHYMRSPGMPKELEAPHMVDNTFSEDISGLDNEAKVEKHLEITSASEDLIPQNILKQIKAEELAKSEEEMRIANNQLESLQSEILFLKKRIQKLENDTVFNEDIQFLENVETPTDKIGARGNSATIQDENLLVVNTGLALENRDSEPFFENSEDNRTAMFLVSALLLSISLLGFRHKSWFSNLTQRFS